MNNKLLFCLFNGGSYNSNFSLKRTQEELNLVKIGRKIHQIGTFSIKFTIFIFLYVRHREKCHFKDPPLNKRDNIFFFIALAVTPLFGKLWVSRIFFLTFAAFSSVAIFVYSQKITIQRSIDDLELVSSFCNDVDPGGLCGEPWEHYPNLDSFAPPLKLKRRLANWEIE